MRSLSKWQLNKLIGLSIVVMLAAGCAACSKEPEVQYVQSPIQQIPQQVAPIQQPQAVPMQQPTVVYQQAPAPAPSNDNALLGGIAGFMLGHALSGGGSGGGGGNTSVTRNTTVVNKTIVNKTYTAPPKSNYSPRPSYGSGGGFGRRK